MNELKQSLIKEILSNVHNKISNNTKSALEAMSINQLEFLIDHTKKYELI